MRFALALPARLSSDDFSLRTNHIVKLRRQAIIKLVRPLYLGVLKHERANVAHCTS